MGEEGTAVQGMMLELSAMYGGVTYSSNPESEESSLAELAEALMKGGYTFSNAEEFMEALSSAAERITTTIGFSGYTNGVKEQLKSIDGGIIELTMIPEDMGGANGIIPMEMDSLVVAMTDGSTYTISSSELYAAMIEGELLLPAKDDRSPITIADAKGNSQTVEWKVVASSPENKTDGIMYAEEDRDSLAAAGFYTHFGSHHFLNVLYEKMNDEEGSYDELVFGDGSFIVAVDEYSVATFPVDITFTGYNYYKNGTPQSVSGTVYLEFSGAINSTEFKATSFSIRSNTLILSDDSNKHGNASIAFGTEDEPLSGFFGNNGNGSIAFTVTEDVESGGDMIITGITKYTTENTGIQGETAYDAAEHAFGLNDYFPALGF